MPLSEHEQRLLEQIEKALYAEDPKFASTVRSTDPRARARRRAWVGAAVTVLGVIVMISGLVMPVTVASIPVVGVAGFLVMFAGAVFAATNWKRMTGREPLKVVGGTAGGTRQRAGRASLLDRMEDRWRRRDQERGV